MNIGIGFFSIEEERKREQKTITTVQGVKIHGRDLRLALRSSADFVAVLKALPARKPVGKSEHITIRHRTDVSLFVGFHKLRGGDVTCSSSASTAE